MKIAHNKINIGKDVEKKIRKLFFQKVEMKEICNTVSLSESVVRRIVWEHRWQQKRIRYYRLLCFLSYKWGVSLGEISKRSGVGYCTITKIRRQLGISKAKRKAWNKRLTKDIEEKFVREYDAGRSRRCAIIRGRGRRMSLRSTIRRRRRSGRRYLRSS